MNYYSVGTMEGFADFSGSVRDILDFWREIKVILGQSAFLHFFY